MSLSNKDVVSLCCEELGKIILCMHIKLPNYCVRVYFILFYFFGPRRDRCSADRLTVCAAIVVDTHLGGMRGWDDPVGPETKPKGFYCHEPV